jgi:hypothetical protein
VRLFASEFKVRATSCDVYLQSGGNLLDIFIKRTAQIGEAEVIFWL